MTVCSIATFSNKDAELNLATVFPEGIIKTLWKHHLDVSHHPCGLHATGHIHSVSPDVKMRFTGPDNTSQNAPFIQPYGENTQRSMRRNHGVVHTQLDVRPLTDAEHEVIEGLVVDVHQRDFHGQSKISQICQVLPPFPVWNLFFLLGRTKKITLYLWFITTPIREKLGCFVKCNKSRICDLFL